MAKSKRKLTLNEKAEMILSAAEESGLKDNYFFVSTFNRYRVQLKVLDELEKVIDSEGALVTKEYVKGRGNVYTHPAITEYNKTATAANGTVATLINILKNTTEEKPKESKFNDIMAALNE